MTKQERAAAKAAETENKNTPPVETKEETPTTALATVGPVDLATLDLSEYGEDAGKGFEDLEEGMTKLPMVRLLQPGSPIIGMPKQERPPHLAHAEAGMLMDMLSEELIPICRSSDPKDRSGIEVLIAHVTRSFLEWKPDRGGFAGRHTSDEPEVIRARKGERTKVGYPFGANFLKETYETYYVYRSPRTGAIVQSYMGLESTAIDAIRDWLGKTGRTTVPNQKDPSKPHTFSLYAFRGLLYSKYVPKDADRPAYFKLHLEPAYLDSTGQPSFLASLLPKSDPRYAVAKNFQADVVSRNIEFDVGAAEKHEAKKSYAADDTSDPGFAGKGNTAGAF